MKAYLAILILTILSVKSEQIVKVIPIHSAFKDEFLASKNLDIGKDPFDRDSENSLRIIENLNIENPFPDVIPGRVLNITDLVKDDDRSNADYGDIYLFEEANLIVWVSKSGNPVGFVEELSCAVNETIRIVKCKFSFMVNNEESESVVLSVVPSEPLEFANGETSIRINVITGETNEEILQCIYDIEREGMKIKGSTVMFSGGECILLASNLEGEKEQLCLTSTLTHYDSSFRWRDLANKIKLYISPKKQ